LKSQSHNVIGLLRSAALTVAFWVSSGAYASDFEIEGRVLQVFGGTTNHFDFRVTALDARYQIWTRDHRGPSTERTAGYDGTDFHQVDRLADKGGKVVELGHRHSGDGAPHLDGLGGFLRLAFLLGPGSSGTSGPIELRHFSGNPTIFGSDRSVPLTNGPIPATAFPMIRFLGSRPGGPVDESIGEFRVTEWTRFHEVSIPKRFLLRSQLPPSLGQGRPPREMESMSGEVTRISVPAPSDLLPRLTTSNVQVRDSRFLADTGDPVGHTITNRVWPSRQDPWLVKTVRDSAAAHQKRIPAH